MEGKFNSVISWNAAGLIQHYPELFHFLDSMKPKPMAICIQESHLFSKSIPSLTGFSPYDNPRLVGSGGGTTIYVNNDYQCKSVPTFKNTSPTFIEGNSVLIKLFSFELVISNLYLPPNKLICKDMLDNLQVNENHLLVGDFNAKSTLWGSLKGDTRGRIVHDFIDNNNLVCLNDGAGTFLKQNGEMSHLDLALGCGKIPQLVDFNIIKDSWGSDHYPMVINVLDQICLSDRKRPGYNFRKADWTKYKEEFDRLIEVNHIVSVNNSSRDYCVDSMYDKLLYYIDISKDISVPKTKHNTNSNKKYSPYWNKDCQKAISVRRKAEKRFKKFKTAEFGIDFKKCKAKVKLVIKEAKLRYWILFTENLQRDSNLSHIWQLVKSINGKINNSKINPYRSLLSNEISNNEDLANAFSKSFKKISSNENVPPAALKNRDNTIISELDSLDKFTPDNIKQDIFEINSDFTIHELKIALGSCNTKTAVGPDNISYQMLTNLSDSGLHFFLKVLNLSWSSGIIPSRWKSGFVKPILKANR
ncbi:MAG: endonuclease/exonuclease/phosphatase family protein, partial [Nitrososphaeraceae archaeon]|nr:endonuclease/exonuclease/phosphatase family protein [Nitrososphaeraceae archaeon]